MIGWVVIAQERQDCCPFLVRGGGSKRMLSQSEIVTTLAADGFLLRQFVVVSSLAGPLSAGNHWIDPAGFGNVQHWETPFIHREQRLAAGCRSFAGSIRR